MSHFYVVNNSNRILKGALKAFAFFFCGCITSKSHCISLVDRTIPHVNPMQGADYSSYFGDYFQCAGCVFGF